ncbi:glucosyltransferase domain-containing protein [Acidocella sp.]|uniref:glucosyltransferase domain-containing protein n=1 Tax=Acidocella sp. TaxID=50710 RepID=UPI003CFD3778
MIFGAAGYYDDDIGRALFGGHLWSNDGRPFADLIYFLLILHYPWVDIAPLPQLLAAALTVGAALAVIRHYEHQGLHIPRAVALLPLGSPLYLQNLAYHFVSVTMAMSIVLAVSGFLIRPRAVAFYITGALSLYAALGTYQTAINIFLSLALFDLIGGRRGAAKHTGAALALFGLRLSQAGLALLIYQWTITPMVNGYAGGHKDLLPLSGLVPGLLHNLGAFSGYIGAMLAEPLFAPCLLLLCVGWLGGVLLCVRGEAALPTRIVSLLAWGFGAPLCVAGALAALRHPVLQPRVFDDFGWFLFCCAMALYVGAEARGWLCRVVTCWVGIVLLNFLVAGMVFKNAYAAQWRHENRIAGLLAEDLYGVFQAHPEAKYVAGPGSGYSPLVLHYMRAYPFVWFLVPQYLETDSTNIWFRGVMVLHGVSDGRYALNLSPVVGRELTGCTAQLVRKRRDYWLYYKNNLAYVDFTKGADCAALAR